jgi:RHS repeat-associated protein
MNANMPMTEIPDYRARYYDPSIGRFISEDPTQFAGSATNFYAYTENNPINLTDPSGLCDKRPLCISMFLSETMKNLVGVLPGVDSPPMPGTDVSTPSLAWIYQMAADYLNPLTLGSAQGGITATKLLQKAILKRATNAVSFSVLLQLDIAMTQALITEINAAMSGQCRAIGED